MDSPLRRRKLERLARQAAGLPSDIAAQIGADQGERSWRELGDGLDALVRAVAHQDRLGEGLARRVHGLWLAMPERLLEVTATDLKLGKNLALAADAQHGRWILPAYMAGLRGIARQPAATPDDLMRLALELARLRAHEDAIERFADWLACACGEGLTLITEAPFAALGAALSSRSLVSRDRQPELCQRAVDGWNGRAWELGRRLDPGEAARRFGAVVGAFARDAEAGVLEVSREELATLRDACSDLAYWSRVETQTVLEEPSLAAGLAPERMASRLDALIASSPRAGNALLSFLADAAERGGDVVRLLDAPTTGAQLADKLDLARVDPALVADVIARLGGHAGSACLGRLLERSRVEPEAGALLVEMLRKRGLLSLVELADRIGSGPLVGRFYAAALDAGEPIARVHARIDAMPRGARAAVLAAAPRLALQLAGETVDALMHAQAGAQALVEALATQGRAGAELLGRALAAGGAARWHPSVGELAMRALVSEGLGGSWLLPLARSSNAPLATRLAAIDAMSEDPRLRVELARWRPSRMREPKQLCERLARLQRESGA